MIQIFGTAPSGEGICGWTKTKKIQNNNSNDDDINLTLFNGKELF